MKNSANPSCQRVAMVTGGSRGIGRATCLALARHGAAVAIHYRNHQQEAEAVAASILDRQGKACVIQADLAEAGAEVLLVEAAVTALGSIDILINNAGEQTTAAVVEMSDEIWSRSLEINLSAAFRLSRACIPAMQAHSWGRIIHVTSQAAYTGSVRHAHYAAAKAGLLGLTFSLAKELGPAGITVNAVVPGRIETEMLADQLPSRSEEWLRQTPLRRFGRPEEVAAAIAFLASEDASYITGAALQVGGGLVMG